MTDIVTTLRQLSSPDAEKLSADERITAFVEAADEIERLRRVVERLSVVARKDGEIAGKLWADNEGPHSAGRRLEAVPAENDQATGTATRRATTKKRQRG